MGILYHLLLSNHAENFGKINVLILQVLSVVLDAGLSIQSHLKGFYHQVFRVFTEFQPIFIVPGLELQSWFI